MPIRCTHADIDRCGNCPHMVMHDEPEMLHGMLCTEWDVCGQMLQYVRCEEVEGCD